MILTRAYLSQHNTANSYHNGGVDADIVIRENVFLSSSEAMKRTTVRKQSQLCSICANCYTSGISKREVCDKRWQLRSKETDGRVGVRGGACNTCSTWALAVDELPLGSERARKSHKRPVDVV